MDVISRSGLAKMINPNSRMNESESIKFSGFIGKKIDAREAVEGETYYFPISKTKAVRVVSAGKRNTLRPGETDTFFRDANNELYFYTVKEKDPYMKRFVFEDEEKKLLSGNKNILRNSKLLRSVKTKYSNQTHNLIFSKLQSNNGRNKTHKNRSHLLAIRNNNIQANKEKNE